MNKGIDTKQFIETHIPQMDSPEKVYQLFQGLGYRTLDASYYDFMVYHKKQEDLLEEGWEYPEDITEEQKRVYRFNIGKYSGNKWGGKYLRAPDIFFTILEKAEKYRFIEYKGESVIVEDVTERVEN